MSIRLCRGFGEEQETLFEKDMYIDNNDFYNLCNSDVDYRNNKYIEIANTVISKTKFKEYI